MDGGRIIQARTDPRVRAEVIQEHRGLVVTIASDSGHQIRRDLRAGSDLDDLIQAGQAGLLHAIDTWDPELGPFGPHASRSIRNAVQAEYGLTRATKRFRARPPSLESLVVAHQKGAADPDDDTPRCLALGDPQDTYDSPDFDFDTIADFGRPRPDAARDQVRRTIDGTPSLTARQREILDRRLKGATQAELGDERAVRRLEERAIAKIRKHQHTPPAPAPRTKGPR